MTKPTLDEIISRRRFCMNDAGEVFKAVVIEEIEERGYKPDERAQRFIMSSEAVDSYGDIVRQDGIRLDRFAANPVALAYHNYSKPIGWWKDVKKVGGKSKRTEGTLTLHAPGTTEMVDEIERLLAADAIRACSIGFKPVEMDWILDAEGRNTYGIEFKEAELFECSVVAIPANPDALAKAAGGDDKLAVEIFERFIDTFCERTTGGLLVRKDFETEYSAIKARRSVKAKPKEDETVGLLKRIEGMLSRMVGAEKKPEFDRSGFDHIVIGRDETTGVETVVSEFPEKTVVTPEVVAMCSVAEWKDAETLVVHGGDEIATYKAVHTDQDTGRIYLELNGTEKVSPESDPEPAAPVLDPGATARARAAAAKVRAEILARGLLS